MSALVEHVGKPHGRIKLINHRGEPILHPWETDYARQMVRDPRFGTVDLSHTEILETYEANNLIVNQASVLQVTRLAPGDLGTAGIGYLAVGTGFGTGTASAPQGEDPTYTQLRAELARKAITSWTYLDGNGVAVGSPPTGIGVLQLTTTFGATEAIGTLVEMGLFGGTATGAGGSGTMFNYKVFAQWQKTLQLNASLTIIWTLSF